MSEKITVQQINDLRSEFKLYLITQHPDWSESTVALRYSDAFYLYNNDIGLEFWSCFTNEDALKVARDRIRDHLSSEKNIAHAKELAENYLVSMRHFKKFLDEKHPNLANDLVGSVVVNDYLKTAFQNWMKRQRKSNGDEYKASTISQYTNALKNSTEKLKLENIHITDMFYYTTIESFNEIYEIIKNAPNFKDIDINAGNAAYSQGLFLYSKFLQEMAEPSCWIFQGNSKYYDVIGYINDFVDIEWSVKQYKNQIQKDDKVYIWLSGKDGGIIASGKIMSRPRMIKQVENDTYNREEITTEPRLAVAIRIDRKLIDNIVPRSVLIADERTKNMSILTFANATNYVITKEQDKVIESIIGGRYVPVPISPIVPIEEHANPQKRYWMYGPGESARFWEEFYDKGIMAIGWDELGDLKQYASKAILQDKIMEIYGEGVSHKNDIHATWQFAN